MNSFAPCLVHLFDGVMPTRKTLVLRIKILCPLATFRALLESARTPNQIDIAFVAKQFVRHSDLFGFETCGLHTIFLGKVS